MPVAAQAITVRHFELGLVTAQRFRCFRFRLTLPERFRNTFRVRRELQFVLAAVVMSVTLAVFVSPAMVLGETTLRPNRLSRLNHCLVAATSLLSPSLLLPTISGPSTLFPLGPGRVTALDLLDVTCARLC